MKTCTECGGAGFVAKGSPFAYNPNNEDFGKVECPHCRGTRREPDGKKHMTIEQLKACRIVEELIRSLDGGIIELKFHHKEVEIAPEMWAGTATGKTLEEALEEALE